MPATRRRILCLWFPRLAADGWRRRHADVRAIAADTPLALELTLHQRRLIVGVDGHAAALGIHPGQNVADARALEPGLHVTPADPEADARLLAGLAGWCLRYTPWSALDGADGLALDTTGGDHLFGGEESLLADVTRRLQHIGLSVQAALTDTPAASWGLARFGPGPSPGPGVLPVGQIRDALDPLPVAALRLDTATVDRLSAVGLRRIGDLHGIPRASLAARFGDRVRLRLDQALGHEDEPISPHRPLPRHAVRTAFPEPLLTAEPIAAASQRLLETLSAGLEKVGHGARRLELRFFRVDAVPDQPPQCLSIGTSRASRDVTALFRLFAQRLDTVVAGFGIEAMELIAPSTEPLIAQSRPLPGEAVQGDDAQVAALVDNLANRLGADSVLRPSLRESWWPERVITATPALSSAGNAPLGSPWPADRLRPVRLFSPPEPIEAMAQLPDDPPVLFRWHNTLYRVGRADGPERIAPEWWRFDPQETSRNEARDYYRVEDTEGRRFWVFRTVQPPPRWFLHGLFG